MGHVVGMMKKRIKFMAYAMACAAFMALPVSAGASFLVTLRNGETINAENYKVEDRKIELKMKSGSASFPRSLVVSISNNGSAENLILTPDTVKPAMQTPVPQGSPAAGAPTQPVQEGEVTVLGSDEGKESPADEKDLEQVDQDEVELQDQADKEDLKQQEQEFMQEDPPEVISGDAGDDGN